MEGLKAQVQPLADKDKQKKDSIAKSNVILFVS